MARDTMLYVIAYDVTDDKQRTRLANMLLDYGTRVQKSVFEAELTRAEVKEIVSKSAQYIDKGDSLRLYPLCKMCHSGAQTIGRPSQALTVRLHIV